MTGFQARFDAHVTEANSAIANNTTALTKHPLKLHPAHMRRMFANMSKMLGLVDTNQAKHPEYLAGSPTIIPEKAIELIAAVKPSFDSGMETFLQNVVPPLVEVEEKLSLAVGAADFKIASIKNQQVRSLEQILDRAAVSKRDIDQMVESARKERQGIIDGSEAVATALVEAEANRKKVAGIADLAEKLANGHARQGSLEALVRIARAKSDEIEAKLAEAEDFAKTAEAASKNALQYSQSAKTELDGLAASNETADKILNNATQAGLAASYTTERSVLKDQQTSFAYIFYGIISAVVVYALFFLLPIVRDLIGEKGEGIATLRESAELLFVRLLILAPAVWALIFTNRRYVNLEALQMDYAAKAATALAYSGYRDEMADDPELSKRLKDGLLLRFLEHPSRLLPHSKEDELAKVLLGMSDEKPKTRDKSSSHEAEDDED